MIECKLINNTQYSLDERECFSATELIDKAIPHVVLSTCNRIELYWGEGSASENIVRHLYRVASGLESSLVGERAIQGQLKTAYINALNTYRLSPSLNRLFQTAIHTGKRVRTETRISEGAISHSQVTVDILKQENIDLKQKIVSIVGVNKLTEDILKYLVSRGAVNIFLSNRNIEKAKALAKAYNSTAVSFDHKRSMLEFTDVLICATSAPHTIVKESDISENKDMLIFDLAFPRDVDKAVQNHQNVRLFDLEDIETFAGENRSLRNNEVCKAEQIIEEEMAKFYQWLSYSSKKEVAI